MKIKPLTNFVQIGIAEAKAGVLDTSSRHSAVEYAEVLEVGEGVTTLKKGDFIFVKAWAVDIITYEEKKYYFVNLDTKGIVAIVT